MPGMIRERERRVNRRENEKDDRKLAFVGRVVAKERKIEKQQNRDKMDKARTCAKPVRLSATSNLHVPSSMSGKEKERDRRMGEGPRKWIEKRWARRGRQVQFLTVSHWFPVPSSMP